jgi:hypothetical protein
LVESSWRRRRDRRAAAQLIFAELTQGAAAAGTALVQGNWSSRSDGPERHAWNTYGVRLFPTKSIDRVAVLAQAYRALEDVAWWVGQQGAVAEPDMRAFLLNEVDRGLLAVAELAGRDRADLEQSLARAKEADERFRKESNPGSGYLPG